MARRSWGRSVLAALLSAAGLAAAQLGLGYGLGIISWPEAGADSASDTGAWSAALVWTVWIGATSVVVGAVIGDRLGGSAGGGWFGRAMWRLVVALAATLGALVTIPLVAVPAQGAVVVDNYAPHLLASVYAAIGAVLGLVVAVFALVARAIAANVIATAGWLWVLAVIAVTDGVTTGRGLGYAQLAVWKFTDEGPIWRQFYLPGVLVMLGSALLIGGLAAFPSAGRGASRIGVAVSGGFGPLLVAVAYLVAAPDKATVPFELASAEAASPYMVLAGLAGSVLVAAIGGPAKRKPAKKARGATSPANNTDSTNPPPATGFAAVAVPSSGNGIYHSRASAQYSSPNG